MSWYVVIAAIVVAGLCYLCRDRLRWWLSVSRLSWLSCCLWIAAPQAEQRALSPFFNIILRDSLAAL